jgi:hypothetical protein
MTIFHLDLKVSADRGQVGSLLFKKYSPNVIFFWLFGNLPNHLICLVWTPSMKRLREISESFQREEAIESAYPNILYTGFVLDTWRDRLLRERGAIPPRKTG